ncbi:MAG: hypothetical protein Q9181_006144 [Wetmoreana brouardii]
MTSRSNKRRRVTYIDSKRDDGSDSDLFETSATAWTTATGRRTLNDEDCPSKQASISHPSAHSFTQETYGDVASSTTTVAGKPMARNLEPSSLLGGNDISHAPRSMASPIQLSTVNGLPASSNIDTVSLSDILGDPLIKECWLFNYCFDIDFVMSQLDADTKDLVQVKVVHGSWKTEDSNRVHIEEAAKRYQNLQIITAYMAEMYVKSSGTHHSKMIILFRHDKQAQVNIITGNFLVRDWSMCQAVWRSPLLPLQHSPSPPNHAAGPFPIGKGLRFKRDLLAYLKAYGQSRTGSLTGELAKYDFNSIHAALIASVPGKQNLRSIDPERETLWGWPALRHILSSIKSMAAETTPHIVMQCSSVASMGEKWMRDTFFKALSTIPASLSSPKPKFSLVFPTADEVRRSVDGYVSGGSIHMKTQNAAQMKQLAYLKPMMYHWAGDHVSRSERDTTGSSPQPVRQALRRRAAPHIKTYVRFLDQSMTKIDWAMMTSANLSKQAWGEAASAGGEVRICSYEIGVVVWPALWDGHDEAEMVPVFGKDMPDADAINDDELDEKTGSRDAVEKKGQDDEEETTDEEGGKGIRAQRKAEKVEAKSKRRIGLRMPYDLPLVPYAKDEMPWCAAIPCTEPDWTGRTWPGFGGS